MGFEVALSCSGAVVEILHAVDKALLKGSVLVVELACHELPHGRIRDVRRLLEVRLDRRVRDEPVIAEVGLQLVLRDGVARHRK